MYCRINHGRQPRCVRPNYARIASSAAVMSAPRPATDERVEHLQPLPGANTIMQRTEEPLPQRDTVYSSSKPCSLRRRATCGGKAKGRVRGRRDCGLQCGGMHLEHVGGTQPLRLVVDVVTADALGERDLLHRLERLPLLQEGALHSSSVTHSAANSEARAVSTCSTGTLSTNTECSVMLSLK